MMFVVYHTGTDGSHWGPPLEHPVVEEFQALNKTAMVAMGFPGTGLILHGCKVTSNVVCIVSCNGWYPSSKKDLAFQSISCTPEFFTDKMKPCYDTIHDDIESYCHRAVKIAANQRGSPLKDQVQSTARDPILRAIRILRHSCKWIEGYISNIFGPKRSCMPWIRMAFVLEKKWQDLQKRIHRQQQPKDPSFPKQGPFTFAGPFKRLGHPGNAGHPLVWDTS